MTSDRLYLFDLDGTLFRGNTVIPGAVETLAELRHRGALVRFLTNNAGQTRDDLTLKLQRLGFEAHPREVYGTAEAAGIHARARGWSTAWVVGEASLAEALTRHGTPVINADSDGVPQASLVATTPEDPAADGVVVGICRRFTYAWLDATLQQLLRGADFVATNRDATYPLEGGRLQPGAGTLVAAVEAACGRAPRVLGKPSPDLVHLALRDAGVAPGDAVVVGDRADTDLAAGIAAGCATFLVLSGATSSLPEGQPGAATVAGLLDA